MFQLAEFLPGGKAVLFTVMTSPADNDVHVVTHSLLTGDPRTVVSEASVARLSSRSRHEIRAGSERAYPATVGEMTFVITYSSTTPRRAAFELIARRAGILWHRSPAAFTSLLSFVEPGDFRRRRVAHHHMAAASREHHHQVAQTLLIVRVESLGRVARESRRLAQRRVRRIEIQKIAGPRHSSTTRSNRARSSVTPGRGERLRRRGGDSPRRRCAAWHSGRPAR